jgi:hypothetical protein
MPDGSDHRHHNTFFLAATQPQNANLGVAKLAANRRFRFKAWEAICILQTTVFFHPGIMASFYSPEKEKSLGK